MVREGEERRTEAAVAAYKYERRQVEILETEDEMLRNMQRLGGILREWCQDSSSVPPRLSRGLLISTHDTLRALRQVHKEVRAQLAAGRRGGGHSIEHVRQLFSPVMRSRLVEWHSSYEEKATQVSAIFQERQHLSVPHDPQHEGHVRAALDLLLRPTQRLMKYHLFLEALISDANEMDRSGMEGAAVLASTLEESLVLARDVVEKVNDAKRLREQHERVRALTECVCDVPEGVRIAHSRRRVLAEAGNIMQRGREGYRTLFVLNDAVLVCKQGMRKIESAGSALHDLRFKDLISLRGISQRLCPSVIPPSAYIHAHGAEDAGSEGVDSNVSGALFAEKYGHTLTTKERAFSFELRGRCFLG
jgi:hypothetical protein